MSAITAGPPCRRCRRTEQECARTYPCCDLCSHRFGEITPQPAATPVFVLEMAACGDPKAGTDTGYYRHVRGTAAAPPSKPCRACRSAHADAERSRVARKQVAS
jgi:hypothetical protein